jgi:predicted secreted protein
MKAFGKESRQIRATVGEPFSVELEAMATAGYVWSLRDPPGLLRPVEETTERGGGGVGAAVRQKFLFEPVAPGSAKLVFQYGRPWEKAATETVEIQVQVEQ